MRMNVSRQSRLGSVGAWIVALVVLCGITTRTYATAAEAALFEGMWKLQCDADNNAERGGRLDFQEYFIIESGTVTVSEMSKMGFAPAPATFTTDAAGNTTASVSMSSRSQGDVTITCTRSGANITGTLVWVRDGQTYTYAYTGIPYTPPSE